MNSQLTPPAPQTAQVDKLQVKTYENRIEMGSGAAHIAAETIRQLLNKQEQVTLIFAAAPSQNEFLASLIQEEGIDWTRINAFHMDEYIGLAEGATQKFGNFLKERIFGSIPFRSVNYLDGSAADPGKECIRYADLLSKHPVDIVFMGIGENCHLAFNDPHVADFDDPQVVKVVDLDLACRQQQVNDQCFIALSEVPTHALTLTIPALMNARYIYCMVPGGNKAEAVKHTLKEPINPAYPSSILRQHKNAILFIERDSASKI